MSLLCPRTQKPLKEITLDGIKIDISEACGGVWFDNFELKKLDEAHETAGDKLVDVLAPFVQPKSKLDARLKCPKCVNMVMMRNYYSPTRCIEIDTCPKCGGVWLDPGELAHLRNLFSTEAEKEAFAQAFVDEVIDKFLEPSKQQGEKELQKARDVAHALRFLCPSFYIKGKQSWGAF